MKTLITPTLAAGAVASPYFYNINVTQALCSPACIANVPTFNPSLTLLNVANVGTSQYIATIHLEGVITYIPFGGSPCCTKSQLVSSNFEVAIFSATAPTSVTIASGNVNNALSSSGCCTSSKLFVSSIPMTLTVA